MKKRILIPLMILILAAVLLTFRTHQADGPQLTDIEVGMTHRDILQLIPGVAHPEYRVQADRPMIYRSGGLLALVIYEEDAAAGYYIFTDRRQLICSVPPDGSFSQTFSADMAGEKLQEATLYDLQDKYALEYRSTQASIYLEHLLLEDGRILTLRGEKVHRLVEHDIYARNRLADDSLGRSPWHNVIFTSAILFDPFAFQSGMYWYQIPSRATRVLLSADSAASTRAVDYIRRCYDQQSLPTP